MDTNRASHRVLVGLLSFTGGVVLLCLLATLQKFATGSSFMWKGYIVPALLGGGIGCFVGLRQLRSRAIAAKFRTESTPGMGTVLVADDEEVVRTVAKMNLQRHGYSVITACDGADAVRVFSENAEKISAVLLDMTMPHLSGEEVFHALRKQQPEIPILLTSGYDEQDTASQFADDSHMDFIQKPYSPQELVEKLKTLVAS